MLLRYAHQLARNDVASPIVDAAMAAKQAASMLWGTNLQKKKTVAPIVSSCSSVSETAVDRDSSTARKYPFIQVHMDINGSPRPNILRQEAASGSPRKNPAAESAVRNRQRAMQRLIVRQKPKHLATTERTVSPFPLARAAVTMRVTARLMPEVERVTVSINIENISW